MIIDRFNKERVLYNSGAELVIGVDEVGRGPLAGPVVAAAVGFAPDVALFEGQAWWGQIADSKKVSEKRRAELFEYIIHHSSFALGMASVEEIEEFNILQASLLAMRRAVERLVQQNSTQRITLLIDGRNTIPNIEFPQQAIVGGDSVVHSIAAASIVAKVHRDKLMTNLAKQFPDYSLDKHKGYGTKFHIEAIKKFGLSPIHRASFCGNIV